MEYSNSNRSNFWNNHTLYDFQKLAILKNVHSYKIYSVCFLKDGRIASSSGDKKVLIYNKITFKIEIRIKERKGIRYMNVNKDGILITCSGGTYVNLYEFKGKKYKNIQTIRPYSLKDDIIGVFDDLYSIQKFIELKNGDIAILVWAYAICFYQKKKNNKKYSFLNKFIYEESNSSVTDLLELDNQQYCIAYKYDHLIKFLDMKSQKITSIMDLKKFYFSDAHNHLLLMNERDLFIAGSDTLLIIDIQKKEITKSIKINKCGYLSSMYKISDNIIIAGFWKNYIEQLEYDKNKKEFKVISKTEAKNKDDYYSYDLFDISSISIFNDKLIVAPYDNEVGDSSLIIYKLKNK